MKQYFEIQKASVIQVGMLKTSLYTLLFLHVREVFKRQRPHWRSPESIRLHYCLQPSPARGTVTEKAGRRDVRWQRKQVSQSDYAHEAVAKREKKRGGV